MWNTASNEGPEGTNDANDANDAVVMDWGILSTATRYFFRHRSLREGIALPLLLLPALNACLCSNSARAAQAPGPGSGGQTISFVRWTEPKEASFAIDVPRGWTVNGGLVRVGPTDVRRSIQVRAPNHDMTVILGDASLPLFSEPTLGDQQMGHGEGYTDMVGGNFQRMVLHYMPAQEFNRWYLEHAIGRLVNDINITEERPLPELSQKLTLLANRGRLPAGVRIDMSVAVTKFTGRVKDTGKAVCGLVLTKIQHDVYSQSAAWHADPVIVACQQGEGSEARVKTVQDVYLHMSQSMKSNAAWDIKENDRINRITAKQMAAMRKAAVSRNSGGNTGGSGGYLPSRADSMKAYWRRNAAREESQHQFINYLRDERDVINPETGERQTVPDHY